MALDFLKKLIYEDDEESSEEVKEKEQRTPPPPSPAPPEHGPSKEEEPQGENLSLPAEIDPKILKEIEGILEVSNFPGPDYLDLMKFVDNPDLQKTTPSEPARMLTAFTMLRIQSPSLTKEVIVDSVDSYVNLLKDHKAQGIEEWKKLYQAEVGEKIQDMESLNSDMAAITKQIEDLKKLYQQKDEEYRKLTQEKAQAESKCLKKRESFEYTFDQVISKITNDKIKLQNNL